MGHITIRSSDLRMELKKAQEQNEKYRHAINNFKAAHNALIDIT